MPIEEDMEGAIVPIEEDMEGAIVPIEEDIAPRPDAAQGSLGDLVVRPREPFMLRPLIFLFSVRLITVLSLHAASTSSLFVIFF